MTLKTTSAAVAGILVGSIFSPVVLASVPASVTVGAVGSTAVPTMSDGLMIGLGLLLAMIALRALKQYGGTARMMCLAVFGGGLAISAIGVDNSMATYSGVSSESSACDGGTETIVTGRPYDANYLQNHCAGAIQVKSYDLPCPASVQIKSGGDVGTIIAPEETVELNICPGPV